MCKSEANDRAIIEQEQADQVRRTTGATLAALALERVLPAVAKGYGPNEHQRAARMIVEDMGDGYRPNDGGGIILSGGGRDTILTPKSLRAMGAMLAHGEARAEILAVFSKWTKHIIANGGAA